MTSSSFLARVGRPLQLLSSLLLLAVPAACSSGDDTNTGSDSLGGTGAGGAAADDGGGASGSGGAAADDGGSTGDSGGAGGQSGCEYGGQTYAPGDSFPSTDGCNTCQCGEDGEVACTLRGCAPATDSGGATTCETLQEERSAELESIQSCTTDDECGQVLTGTSCGCTRNLVARNDADIATFQELSEQMSDMGCGLGGSTCDCPEADGFACEQGRCTWNYVDASQ